MSAQGLAGPLDAPAAREAIHTRMDRNENRSAAALGI
jgi:hypothetical protein